MLCYVIRCRVMLCYVMSSYVILYDITPHCVVTCHVMLCYILCYIVYIMFWQEPHRRSPRKESRTYNIRKGTNGVSTNGVTGDIKTIMPDIVLLLYNSIIQYYYYYYHILLYYCIWAIQSVAISSSILFRTAASTVYRIIVHVVLYHIMIL